MLIVHSRDDKGVGAAHKITSLNVFFMDLPMLLWLAINHLFLCIWAGNHNYLRYRLKSDYNY